MYSRVSHFSHFLVCYQTTQVFHLLLKFDHDIAILRKGTVPKLTSWSVHNQIWTKRCKEWVSCCSSHKQLRTTSTQTMNWVDNTGVDETEADKQDLTAHGNNCIILATPGESLPLHWIAQLIIWQYSSMPAVIMATKMNTWVSLEHILPAQEFFLFFLNQKKC